MVLFSPFSQKSFQTKTILEEYFLIKPVCQQREFHRSPLCLEAALLVVADGADSQLRQSLGVAAGEKPYGQHALVANVGFARDHQGCAYERFTEQGPLALLPLLPAEGAPHRAALVWTLPQEQATHCSTCPDTDFLAALQDRFGYRLGRLMQVGERFSYPLSLLQAEEQVQKSSP